MIYQLIAGLFAGIIVASCGAYKDCHHEPFKKKTFFRSPFIAFVCSIPFAFIELNPILTFFVVIGPERLIVEVYKIYRIWKKKYVPGKFVHGEWGRSRE